MPVWHQNENYLKSYSSQKKLGGGVTLTLSHEIDLAYYIFGKVKSISVINLKNTLNIDVEDKIIVYLEHYNGCISRVYLNFASRFSERKIEVYDQKSKLIYDFNKNYICKNSNIKKNNYKCYVNKDKIYLLEIVDFINSIRLNKKNTCRINIKNTFHTQKVLNKIIKKINLKYCLSA
jgi:predicted dehydrogenase